MSYTENTHINTLINSCGGLTDFRDIIIMENSRDAREIMNKKKRIYGRHFERKKRRLNKSRRAL